MYECERHYPKATLPWNNPDWNEYQASAIKGETEALVDHARKISAESNNTSIDASWWVHQHWGVSDVYTIAVMVLFLVPLFLLLWVPMFLCLLPPVLLNRLYMGLRVMAPSDILRRDTVEWKLHCAVQLLLCIPATILAACILVYSYFVMVVFGMIFLVLSSMVQCRPFLVTERLYRNWVILRPYQGGPSLLTHWEDCVVAVAGSIHRQHFFEFLFSFTNMFFVAPWIKYWLSANIFLENLGERFITQIGKSMADMDIHDIDTQGIKAISRAKNTTANRDEIDAKFFAPHYPYPPSGRRYAIGMQFTSSLTNFVHTTHFRSTPVDGEGPVASLSTSALLPMYRVILWRNNPYHIYTGYVEANWSTGQPTQPDKYLGGEHPMWLINSHNKLAADRNVSWSLGNIDNFFDRFLPLFAHFIRLNLRGREIADEYLAKDRRLGYEASQNQKLAEI